MISTYNLSFKDFLRYDDVKILKGKINFITGKSGCGKSTLLKLINRTEKFSGGDIIFEGKSILEFESIALRKRIKLISQTAFLFSGSIKENFDTFYNYCDTMPLSHEKMAFYLNLAKANFPLDTSCDILSGGEKQRVYIAICFSMESEIVMLDEPTSALDSELAVEVLKNLIEYSKEKGKTLIIISHDTSLVEMFSENTISLCGGGKNE